MGQRNIRNVSTNLEDEIKNLSLAFPPSVGVFNSNAFSKLPFIPPSPTPHC